MSDTSQSKLITDPGLCAAYGAVVRAGRSALGISQSEFASLLGVHRTTLLRLEQGTPPLRIGLCVAAVQVLRGAGFVCETQGLQTASGELEGSGVRITLQAEAIQKAQQKLDGHIPDDNLVRHLLGGDFLPPLQEKPLRKR